MMSSIPRALRAFRYAWGWSTKASSSTAAGPKARPFSKIQPGFTIPDVMAFAAKVALEKSRGQVPEDVSIVGFNDILFAPAISLTTVALDPYGMGTNAILLLLDIINKRIAPPHLIVMQPRLVIRDSCKSLRD